MKEQQEYRIKHPKPLDDQPSFLLTDNLEYIHNSKKPVLDIACGYGRNGMELVKHGHKVLFMDYDEDCLLYIEEKKKICRAFSKLIRTWEWDLTSGRLPLHDNSVSGIINVHYYNEKLIDDMIRVIMPGGFLCFETIDAHSCHENELPEYGFIKHKLELFEMKYYKETMVKNSLRGASACKIFALKQTDIRKDNEMAFQSNSLKSVLRTT